MRRLLPPAEATDDDEQVVAQAYDVPRPTVPGRPWVELCMVTSLDGTTVVDQRSSGLSSDADRTVLSTLRALADVVIVGAGTVRTERYGPPKKAGQRIGVVSHRGDLDPSMPLFTSGAGFLILPEDAPPTTIDSVRAGVGQLDLAAALGQLDVQFVHAEGGPGLNGALLEADALDELNLTLSPQLAGGDGPRLTTHASALSRRMDLVHVLEDDGYLFTRWVRRRP